MIRKLITFPVIFIILSFGSFSLDTKTDEIKEWDRNQAMIDQGADINKKIILLATIIVNSIEDQVMNFTMDDWKTFRIKNNKINLLILFNRLDEQSQFNLDEFRDPLRRDIYERLANTMGWAIENRKNLLKKIEILHFNIGKLAKMIEGTGKSVIKRSDRRQLGLLKAETAVYEVFLSTNPKDGTITIGGKIVMIETGNEIAFSGIYRLNAKSFLESYQDKNKQTKPPDIVVNKIAPQNVKTKKLKVSKIYYQAPDSYNHIEISSNSKIQSGGRMWFELTLPEPGGYLLGYLKDSDGRTFNLFPGTRNAVVNGDYRVPFNLDNPYTDVEKTAAENAISENLPLNKVLIGGYTFDDKPGIESFSFYYTDKRNSQLETIIKKAQNIGKDMPRMKGVLTTGVSKINRKLTGVSRINIDKTISKPAFYHNKLTLTFEHKKN